MPGRVEKNIFKRNNAFSLDGLYGHALAQEPQSQGSYNLQFWYTLPWSSLLHTWFVWFMPGIREEHFKRNNAFSQYDLYGHAPAQEHLPRGVMKFTILVDPSLVIIIYYIFGLSDLCMEVEKQICKEIMHFHYITYMATPEHKTPAPGFMKFTI